MKYRGSCHCGQVAFEVEGDIPEVMSCNCSICQKRGSLLAFVPQSQFRLLAGDDVLTDYQFNKKVIHHLFCATCGVASFAQGEKPGGGPMVAVNVRCLDGVDAASLKPRLFDGKNL